ncbi:MAG: MiaB/RimO family radical SAM methylthiotransferase [Gemmatimonadetes bacterium]|nr:MiaB/RimO family radical SAM methylthiotransferase [Gemmatimonadota bacterium]
MKVHLRTFGCRANQYDTEAVRGMIEASGGEVVDAAADADVVVFNSCTVTADAEADLRRAVRGARKPAIVMGCAAARSGATIAALPNVSHVVAGADLPAIAAALGLDRARAEDRPAVQTGARALLRIQDGCGEHCTFCATTLARGEHRSRSADAIVREALALAEAHPEIVITGIHIGSYGSERGSTLGALMARLVREVPTVRFRLTSIEATEVDDQLAELFADDPRRVAPHLHAPLQSGADAVLKRMGRHWYTGGTYAAAVERIAARVARAGKAAHFALGADVMTGFPGETAADHDATMALVRSLPFTSLHVFPYSARPGTAAARLPHPVDARVSRQRAAELRALATTIGAAHRAARDGQVADIVVIGDGHRRTGLTEDYLSVALPEPAPPRRARFSAPLVLQGDQLSVRPADLPASVGQVSPALTSSRVLPTLAFQS